MTALRRATLLALALTYALIVLGAWVRATGSGLACPDWPTCYGHLLPLPGEIPQGAGYAYHQVMAEWLHRLLASVILGPLFLVIGWLAWRISRVMDSNASRLSGREQLWIGDGWAARFGMTPGAGDFGRGASHTRQQVRAFRASAEFLLAYHDAAYERMKKYLVGLTEVELSRQLDEPRYQPLPTVAVRLVSVLERAK